MSDKKLPKIKVLKSGPKFKEKPWEKEQDIRKEQPLEKKVVVN